jgi:hypothetical protein
VAAARDALPTRDAGVARQVLAADLGLLAALDTHMAAAETELARLLPRSPFRTLTSVPGWGVIRAGNYGAALGDPNRWPGPPQDYHPCSTNPQAGAATGRSAAKAASRCAAR